MRNEVFLKNKPVWILLKCMVSMATRNVILENWGVASIQIISQQLLTLDNTTCNQIEV